MRNLLRATLFFGSILAFSVQAEQAPQILEGRIIDVVNAGSFVLEGEQRAVVYHRARTQTALAVGDRVRVVGQPIDDWVRMDGVEINADTVEPINP